MCGSTSRGACIRAATLAKVAVALAIKKEQPPRWSLPFEPHPELLLDRLESVV